MKLNSFRSKITLTLVIVIGSISFVSFYIYNNSLSKKIYVDAERNIISILDLLRGQYFFSIHKDGGNAIFSLLNNMEQNEGILRVFLTGSNGDIIYPADIVLEKPDALNLTELKLKQDNDIILNHHRGGKTPYLRAYIRLQDYKQAPANKLRTKMAMGFIVIDFSMNQTEESVAYAQKFSIFFTIIMLVVIGGFVVMMHYKFVRKSLGEFQDSINIINEGNLDERMNIPESQELATLGKGFNEMIATFQKTQQELEVYHKKELRSNRRLATIGEMSARLAHELRNPITGIANAIEIIVEETKDDQNKEILEEVKRQADRVNNTITDLLKYSRSKELNLAPGDINSIISSLVFFLQNQPKNENIVFKMDLQPDIPIFDIDVERIEDVLLNLAINAIQAMNAKGEIIYMSKFNPFEKTVVISVKDNGPGIPEDKISMIFNPFYTTRTEGTGLGLANAKDTINKHDGEIWAENNTDKGSIFTILLPIEVV